MAVDKEIKFKFVVDQTSLSQAKRQIEELVSSLGRLRGEAQSMVVSSQTGSKQIVDANGRPMSSGAVSGQDGNLVANAVAATTKTQNLTLGGGGGNISSSFTKLINEHRNLFKGMAKGGQEGIDSLTRWVKKGVGEQTQELDKLEKKIKDLQKAYDQKKTEWTGSKDKDPAAAKMIQDQMDRIDFAKRKREEEKASVQAKIGELESVLPQKRSLGSQLTAERDWRGRIIGDGQIEGGGPIAALRRGLNSPLGAIAAGVDVTNFGFKEYAAGTRSFSSESARRGQLVESNIRQLMAGDVRTLMNLRAMNADSGAKEDMMAQTGTFAKAEQIKDATSQALGGLPIVGQLAQLVGLAEAPKHGGMFQGFSTMTQQTNMAENLLKQIGEQGMKTIQLFSNMAQEKFMSEIGQRQRAERVLGLKGLKVGALKNTDDFADRKLELEARGYSLEEEMGAFQSIRGIAGDKAAYRRKRQAMAAQSAGYGGYENLLGISERMGKGDLLAKMAIGGGIDATAGIQFGSALLGTGFSAAGMTSGAGVMGAFQAGFSPTGEASDFIKTQQALAGLQFGNSLMSGGAGSPYLQGANTLAAIQAAPNGGSVLQDYLAQMDARTAIDIIKGNGKDVPPALLALGGDSEMVKRTFSRKIEGSLNTVYTGDMKENTPMKRAFEKWREYQRGGGGAVDYLEKLKKENNKEDIQMLFRGAAIANTGFANSEAGAGFGALVGGMLDKSDVKSAKGLGRELSEDTVEANLRSLMARNQKMINDALKIIAPALGASYNNADAAVKKFAGFGEGTIESAEELGTALMELATTVYAVSESMKTGKPVTNILPSTPRGNPANSRATPPSGRQSQSAPPMSSQPMSSQPMSSQPMSSQPMSSQPPSYSSSPDGKK